MNAGHNPQFVVRRVAASRRSAQPACRSRSTPATATPHPRQGWNAGDLLFFYTDGLVEAENAAGDMIGSDRLQAMLTAEQGEQIADVLRHIEEQISDFRGKAELFDDATMMALRIS